ncbi:hypothetical protein IFM89_013835 [Coptis chinensis]|uniref:Uncharacterized protein n=1 Tax=Coptis chinensis TaxID=261450 RepID=A0A835IW21_9MAGN|nr:hypothetical protein IFM89_013835 [Coptis chinensis]
MLGVGNSGQGKGLWQRGQKVELMQTDWTHRKDIPNLSSRIDDALIYFRGQKCKQLEFHVASPWTEQIV